MAAVIEAAREQGVIFVAAAGNAGTDNDLYPFYPASYPMDNVISVANHSFDDKLAYSSCYGAMSVDIAAPGTYIRSCVNSADNAYGWMTGTSMATPHISGALALVLEQYPNDDYLAAINRIYSTAVVTSHYQGKLLTNGRVNLAAALGSGGTPVVPAPVINTGLIDLSLNVGSDARFFVLASSDEAMSYEWFFNDVLLPNENSDALDLSDIAEADAGVYKVVVSNSGGSVNSSATLEVLVPAESLAEAVDAPEYTFSTRGDALWLVDDSVSAYGDSSAVSGNIADGESSTMSTTMEGPGFVKFYWKTSSERSFDKLSFSVDGQMMSVTSGDSGWRRKSVYISSGSHLLEWTYKKDEEKSLHQDAAWVDRVRFQAYEPPAPRCKLRKRYSALEGAPFYLRARVRGLGITSYQWYLNGNPIAGKTSRTLYYEYATLKDEGTYSVSVTGDGGTGYSNELDVAVYPNQLAEALDNDSLPWILPRPVCKHWHLKASNEVADGDYAQSSRIRNRRVSRIATDVEGAGELSFDWMVSSEENYDFLKLYVDGALISAISGDVDWSKYSVIIQGNGKHRIMWEYSKDRSGAVGRDKAYLNAVIWSPNK